MITILAIASPFHTAAKEAFRHKTDHVTPPDETLMGVLSLLGERGAGWKEMRYLTFTNTHPPFISHLIPDLQQHPRLAVPTPGQLQASVPVPRLALLPDKA